MRRLVVGLIMLGGLAAVPVGAQGPAKVKVGVLKLTLADTSYSW